MLVREAQLRPPSRSVRGACYVAQRFWTEQGRRLAASDASIWEVDDADEEIERAQRASADPLPVAPGEWQGSV